MPAAPRPRTIFPWLLAALVLLCVLVNLRWLWLFRRDQPYDIDEAGYLGIALQDWLGLRHGGLSGWIAAVEAPSIQAPLTTAAASLAFALVGPHPLAGFAVPVLAHVLCILAAYALARERASGAASLAAAALVASCPMIVTYARSFHFALPATATTLLALLCLVRSRHMSRPVWASLFGVCLGLLPLARTVTIAFLPGVLLAALLWCVPPVPGGRLRQVGLLCWSLLLALAVAESWLWWNGQYVFSYLFSFGYGSRAAEFGAHQSAFGLTAWLSTLRGLLDAAYVPHVLVLLAGVCAMPLVLAASLRGGMRAAVALLLASPVLPVAICAAEALAALTSSQNKGSAFLAPVLPLLLILSVWMLAGRAPGRAIDVAGAGRPAGRRLLGACCALVCMAAALPLVDASWAIAAPWTSWQPPIGAVPITDGRGTIELYEHNAGFGPSDAAMPLTRAQGTAWMVAVSDAATLVGHLDPNHQPVAFGFRHYMFNVNDLRLLMLLVGAAPPDLKQIEPLVTGNTAAGDRAWLTTGDAAHARLLLTRDRQEGEFEPPVDRAPLDETRAALGFHAVGDLRLPDGSTVTLWAR